MTHLLRFPALYKLTLVTVPFLKLIGCVRRLKEQALMTFTTWALISTLVYGQAVPTTPPAPAEPKPAAQTPQVPADADSMPVSIDRIQRALALTPKIRPSEVSPVFRVEVLGKLPP